MQKIALSRIFSLRLPLLLLLALAPFCARAQQPADPGDARGRLLLQQMVTALGGDGWLDIKDSVTQGRTAAFYQGRPTEQVTLFWLYHRAPAQDLIELTKQRDIIHVFNATEGVEITYKGRQFLPKDAVDAALRRRAHSLDAVARIWMKDPTATVFSMGTSIVGRRQADKVRIVNAKNDNVTVELDTNSHLPLRCTFRFRNATYKDYDEDAEEYEDYQTIQGFPTAFSVTLFHNGEMVEQRFINKVQYNVGLPANFFDPLTIPIPKK